MTSPLMLHSHDGPMHLARMPAYYKALSEGQILPRWAGDLYWGYGMPLFNFYYHVPYLITSAFMAFGVGLVTSFKLSLLLSFLLSGCFMFLFAKKFFRDTIKALLATALYQFAPFHMVNVAVRADTGETLALAFLPLVLYTIQRGFENKNFLTNAAYTGIAMALLLLSHTAVGLMCFGISVLFILCFAPNNKKRLEGAVGLSIGLLLDAFYWIPILLERKYTYGDEFMKDMYKSHFAPLVNFFIPNLTNNASLQQGGVDVSFGLVQTIGLMSAIWLILKKKIQDVFTRRIVLFTGTLIVGALFIMQPLSRYLWEHISVLRAFQFPWRFLNVVVFATSLLSAAVLIRTSTPRYVAYAVIALTILSSMVYWRPPLGFDRIQEADFWNYPLNTTYFGETDLIWSAHMPGKYPKEQFAIIEGKGDIVDPVKKQTRHTFTVNAQTPVRIVDHTQYYPGWRVYSGEEKIPIEFQDQNWRGLITFKLEPGTHAVTVNFGESPIRAVSEIISVSTMCLLGLALFIRKYAAY